MAIAAPSLAATAAVLADLREVITSGYFTRTQDKDDCRYCDYVAVCGAAANAQAKAKLADPKAASFVRLTAHV